MIALDDPRPGCSRSLDETVARRVAFLTDYQNAAYASAVQGAGRPGARGREAAKAPGFTGLAEAVARYAFKLMAYKDEYEVARLYTSGDFEQRLRETFDGDFKLHFHLAPPLLAKKDAARAPGQARVRPLDVQRLQAAGEASRACAAPRWTCSATPPSAARNAPLIGDYRKAVEELLGRPRRRPTMRWRSRSRSIPEHIRGYGHVKEAHLATARARWDALMAAWRKPQAARGAA